MQSYGPHLRDIAGSQGGQVISDARGRSSSSQSVKRPRPEAPRLTSASKPQPEGLLGQGMSEMRLPTVRRSSEAFMVPA
jgi:hypothetical protein